MSYLIEIFGDLAQNPLVILFVIQLGTIGFLIIERKHISEKLETVQSQLDSLRRTNSELNTKYHLLDSHTILLSHILEHETGRKLSVQGPQGDWRTSRPLSG